MTPENGAMIHSLVAPAHNIGMQVIVEGVEKPEQLDLIRKFGGNEIQGYLMERPIADPASQLCALFRNQDKQDVNRPADDSGR